MNIVIDIPDKKYHAILNHAKEILDPFSFIEPQYLYLAVINGTPLPKGYGRLGDLDALREEVSSWGMNDYEPSDFIDEIDRAVTIIEADVPKLRKGTPLEENDSGYNCENWIP